MARILVQICFGVVLLLSWCGAETQKTMHMQRRIQHCVLTAAGAGSHRHHTNTPHTTNTPYKPQAYHAPCTCKHMQQQPSLLPTRTQQYTELHAIAQPPHIKTQLCSARLLRWWLCSGRLLGGGRLARMWRRSWLPPHSSGSKLLAAGRPLACCWRCQPPALTCTPHRLQRTALAPQTSKCFRSGPAAAQRQQHRGSSTQAAHMDQMRRGRPRALSHQPTGLLPHSHFA